MRTKHIGLALGLIALAGVGRAQTTAPAGPPPPQEDPYNYRFNNGSGPVVQGTISIPYAFKWNAVGVSADLGAVFQNQHFIGGEVSYYGGDSKRYNVYDYNGNYLGNFRSNQNFTTIDVAYRYSVPIGYGGTTTPISFYIGGSVGVAFMDNGNQGGFYGFRNRNDGNFTAEGVAGFQFFPFGGRGVGAKVGYRYLYIDNAWNYDSYRNMESNVVEASLTFRF